MLHWTIGGSCKYTCTIVYWFCLSTYSFEIFFKKKFQSIVATSVLIYRILFYIPFASPTNSPVFVEGETNSTYVNT